MIPSLSEAICLDAFAGSGALGFEALSRGAQQVTMFEKHPQAIQHLKYNAKKLLGTAFSQVSSPLILYPQSFPDTANAQLNDNPPLQPFSVVFLDPPFSDISLLQRTFNWLGRYQNTYFASTIHIYLETQHTLTALNHLLLPKSWYCLREKKAGHVRGFLFVSNR